MARWTIGLVGLATGLGCATADTSDFTASSPFATGQPSGVGDGAVSEGTGDDGGDDETGGNAAEDEDEDGGTPTVGPIDTGDEGGAVVGDCCTAQEQGGCSDAMIEACVCGQDPVCCDEVWDDVCVESVAGFGCGDCGGGNPPPPDEGGDEGPPPPPAGACCAPQAMPGCADGSVEMCVCEADAYCCEMEWDEECVALVDELGCGDCGGAPADDGGAGGGCCMPTGVPGCGDPMVEECVCGVNGDFFCCVIEWDDVCASEVAEFGCGAC
jgi:hypothetical protein